MDRDPKGSASVALGSPCLGIPRVARFTTRSSSKRDTLRHHHAGGPYEDATSAEPLVQSSTGSPPSWGVQCEAGPNPPSLGAALNPVETAASPRGTINNIHPWPSGARCQLSQRWGLDVVRKPPTGFAGGAAAVQSCRDERGVRSRKFQHDVTHGKATNSSLSVSLWSTSNQSRAHNPFGIRRGSIQCVGGVS